MRLTIPLMPFQSTPSVGRATIHTDRKPRTPKNFNPRPPWGGRPDSVANVRQAVVISIHALRGEGDNFYGYEEISEDISIHALRGEGDIIFCVFFYRRIISIHALRGEGD